VAHALSGEGRHPLARLAGRGAAAVMRAAIEGRRKLYELGLRAPERVPARVVSIGNLTVGGAGKTTLALHLAGAARERGERVAVVARRYRPGRSGRGDEELLYRARLGEGHVFAGRSKREQARAAAASGASLVIVDDGFSHWGLDRDLDIVLLDRTDLWGGGRLVPAGRLREPVRSIQRAGLVVVTRLERGEDPEPLLAEVRRRAPAALVAAARHAVAGVRDLAGAPIAARGPARVVTATGNPGAVAASAAEAGFHPVALAAYRDHHWFTLAEARREHAAATGATLLLSAKDAVRWPGDAPRAGVAVLETRWEWVRHGAAAERLVWDRDESKVPGPVRAQNAGARA
jgi:tetraacyldisaccharide 4'-kinase